MIRIMEITCCQCGYTVTLKQALMQRGRLVDGYCPDCFDAWKKNIKLMNLPYSPSIKRLVGCFLEWEVKKYKVNKKNMRDVAFQYGYYPQMVVEETYKIFQKFKKVNGLW